jgi:hypothetical protein
VTGAATQTVIIGIGIEVAEVKAVDVVDVAVAVVVDAVASDFARIDPDIVTDVRVIDVDA